MIAKRQSAVRARIDASAFVAVLLALITAFFFSLYVPPHSPLPISVANVVAHHSTEQPDLFDDHSISITVTQDGQIFFRRDKTIPKNLPYLIQNALSKGAEPRIYLNIDKRAKYQDVSAVLDAIHDANVQKVSFLTNGR